MKTLFFPLMSLIFHIYPLAIKLNLHSLCVTLPPIEKARMPIHRSIRLDIWAGIFLITSQRMVLPDELFVCVEICCVHEIIDC